MSLIDIRPPEGKTILLPASTPDSARDAHQPTSWPEKHDIFGVKISATTYAEVIDVLIQSAKRRRPTIVDFAPVSVLVEGAQNPIFRSKLNCFDLVCPDGQPVRWCLNHFQKVGLRETVCGTTATLLLCERAAQDEIGIYLYGSTPETLQKLQTNLLSRFPRLRIVGTESPPFSSLSPGEHERVADRINGSGAGLVFVGIGSPKQENFVWEQRSRIRAVQLCVGAAFDFIAGTKRRAPRWMQDSGLEWMHRVCSEPVRLGKRYTLGNARFVTLVLRELLRSSGYCIMRSILGSVARQDIMATNTDVGGRRSKPGMNSTKSPGQLPNDRLKVMKGSAGRLLQRLGAGRRLRRRALKSRDCSVLIVGPGPMSQGGISAVVAMHKNCSCWDSQNCIWLETMNGGSGVTKLVTAVIAFGRAVMLLPRTRLMHIHMALGASLFRKFPFFALARTFNKATVVHLHDFDSRFNSLMGGPPSLGRTLCALMLRHADRVVALSRSWEQIILRHVPAARTCCLPNPYWLPPGFQPANRTGRSVLYLNRIESRKGYEHLLGAVPEVLKHCPRTTFVLAGHGDVVSARRIVASLGIERAVEFPGWVEGDRKWRLLAEADILCLPSFAEGVPITLLEAMGAGLAVVTTPVGGIPDVVRDGENGILVQSGDVTGIAESLIRLLTDADLRGRLSDAGRRTVEKMNSLPVIDKTLKNLYAELEEAALIHPGRVNTIRS